MYGCRTKLKLSEQTAKKGAGHENGPLIPRRLPIVLIPLLVEIAEYSQRYSPYSIIGVKIRGIQK